MSSLAGPDMGRILIGLSDVVILRLDNLKHERLFGHYWSRFTSPTVGRASLRRPALSEGITPLHPGTGTG
ncbi:hypothetical protein DEO48_23485 [Enterobacter sp. CGMCC 5087]|nr:hypothetical protein DEO48_23485 [Enterobacter sp. CGMCC 5087]